MNIEIKKVFTGHNETPDLLFHDFISLTITYGNSTGYVMLKTTWFFEKLKSIKTIAFNTFDVRESKTLFFNINYIDKDTFFVSDLSEAKTNQKIKMSIEKDKNRIVVKKA